MPHPIYGAPSHTLEAVHFRLGLPLRRNQYQTTLEVKGTASTRISRLWFISEQWTPEEQEAGLQPADAIHHLAMIALQDHPASQERVFQLLTGQRWVQEELPLE